MATVFTRHNVALAPVAWPQDKLTAPSGFGTMSDVDYMNAVKTRQEFFVYSESAVVGANGSTTEIVIPLDKDGDFWCNNLISLQTTPFQIGLGLLVGDVSLRDNINGYNLYTPSVPYMSLERIFPNVDNNETLLYQPWSEPYCFRRGGSISITLFVEYVSPTVAQPLTVWFSLVGWKEYAHASR